MTSNRNDAALLPRILDDDQLSAVQGGEGTSLHFKITGPTYGKSEIETDPVTDSDTGRWL